MCASKSVELWRISTASTTVERATISRNAVDHFFEPTRHSAHPYFARSSLAFTEPTHPYPSRVRSLRVETRVSIEAVDLTTTTTTTMNLACEAFTRCQCYKTFTFPFYNLFSRNFVLRLFLLYFCFTTILVVFLFYDHFSCILVYDYFCHIFTTIYFHFLTISIVFSLYDHFSCIFVLQLFKSYFC